MDDVDQALEEVAEAAEQVAADQHEVARQARRLDRARNRGLSWAEALDRQRPPGLLARLRDGRRQLDQALTQLSRFLANGMAGEGVGVTPGDRPAARGVPSTRHGAAEPQRRVSAD